jgi:hypothetical protein
MHNAGHMHGLRNGVLFFRHLTHPIDDQPGQMSDLIAIVNNQPSHRLCIVARGGKPGNVDKFGEDLAFDGPFLIGTDGPSGVQKMFDTRWVK